MILGISGSPRPNGITAHAVKKVLADCDDATEYISLAGKHIGGCISCLACTKDNICAVNDDFPAIAEKMVQADAIIFGIPNYYDLPNGLSHCLLERCFCFRHQSAFLLEDKPAVILSTGYASDEENSQVLKVVENFIIKNNMKTVSKFWSVHTHSVIHVNTARPALMETSSKTTELSTRLPLRCCQRNLLNSLMQLQSVRMQPGFSMKYYRNFHSNHLINHRMSSLMREAVPVLGD